MTGEFRMTMDPSEKDALLYVPGAGLTLYEQMGMAARHDRFTRTDGTHLGTGQMPMSSKMNEFERLEQYTKLQKPPSIKFKDLEAVVNSHITFNTLPDQGPDGLYAHDRVHGADQRYGPARQQGPAVPGQGRRFEGDREHVRAHYLHGAPYCERLGGAGHDRESYRDAERDEQNARPSTPIRSISRPEPTGSTWS